MFVGQGRSPLIAAWNHGRSWEKQVRTHGRKCALMPTAHHAQAAGETASKHENGSGFPRLIGKGGLDIETSALYRSTRYAAALAS